MATRKQRRRREKERRHEWEEVYVDETGREVDPEEADSLARSRASSNGRAPTRRPAQARGRQRVVEPPSWRRVAKRSLVFAPFMFLILTFLDSGTPLDSRIVYTLQLMLLFMPFSYLVDSFAYRMYRRRTGQGARSQGEEPA
ncbi:MAG: hypothetical protein ICV64_03140 [Thermoleophilia bacterium]|nr:hypothetical protein [Thermoleophilia bacterium]